ncbi:unnamed protein product [Symbiodinium sp. CCMP2456]|nr:unnamed protein product [Symbiodinium sp. CCMP2456]
MRRLAAAALEERRQEAVRQEAERQRLAELQRLQREAEEKLRREELLEKRLESLRRQEEEKEKRAAAMQQEELRQKEAEQHGSQLQQQDFLPSGCDEVNRNELPEQVAQDQENQDGRNSEEVPQQQSMQTNEEALQQSREDLPEDAAGLAGPCAKEGHCNQAELDMKQEKVEDIDSQEEGMCKTQVLEQEPSTRQSQEEEVRTVSTNLAELEVQDHDGKETPLQEPPLCQEAVELPRVALRGFQPVPVKFVEAPEKEVRPDASPEDGCSDLTEIDAATEPLHSDDQSQPSQAEQTEQALPEAAPAEPPQAKEPQRPLCSPNMMWGHDREQYRGELFLELGRRLGRTDQDFTRTENVRTEDQRPSREVEAPTASASASLVAAEAALRAAAQQRMASVQHLTKGPTCVQTLCAPVPRPQDQEACRNATARVQLNKGQIPTIARSLSPVRIVASGRPCPPRVLAAPPKAEGQAPFCVQTDSAQAVGMASGAAWQPVHAGVLTARGVPVQKECTQPSRGLSPVPMRFRSLVVPAAAHHPAPGSADCHAQATAGERSQHRQPPTPGAGVREMSGIGLARYPQAENMIPVFRPQKIASQSGSVQAPVSQQVELLRQMPGSPVYAARQLPLAGSFVAPAARPMLEPWPGRCDH